MLRTRLKVLGRPLLMLVALSAATTAGAAQLLSGVGGSTLLVTESAAPGQTQTAVNLATPLNADGARSGQLVNTTVGNSTSLGVIPADTIGVQSSTTAAATAISQYLQPYLQTEANVLQTALQGTKDAGALYSYVQSVQISQVSGSPTTAQIEGTLWVPPAGAYQWLGTTANSGVAYILYGQYQQSQAAYGLPTGWTMQNPGDFTWELMQVTLSGSATTESVVSYQGSLTHIVTANGIYDAPLVANNVIENCTASASDPTLCNQPAPGQTYPETINGQQVAYDPNTGYNYLVSNLVTPLMTQTGATEAIINYGRAIQPVYSSSTSANGSQTAVVAVSVNNRTFTNGNCGAGASLANAGDIGYLLNETNDEYLVTNGISTLLNTVTQSALSPTQAFNQSATLPSGAQYSTYANDIVNPFGGGQIYNWQNDTVNGLSAADYVNVASLVQQGSPSAASTGSSTTLPDGAQVCLTSTIVQYQPGTYWYGTGQYYQNLGYGPDNAAVLLYNGQPVPVSSFKLEWAYAFGSGQTVNVTTLPGGYIVDVYTVFPAEGNIASVWPPNPGWGSQPITYLSNSW